MLRSMTGFGRVVHDAKFGQLIVEIQSVNRKYLEVFVAIPKEYSRFEQLVRKLVKEHLSRGQVSLRILVVPHADSFSNSLPKEEVLYELKKGWLKIAKKTGFDPKEITLSFILQNMPAYSSLQIAKEEEEGPLSKAVLKAISELVSMKKAEGKALSQDLAKRCKSVEKMVSTIEKLSPNASLKMREKLLERLSELTSSVDERLFKEVAIFAEKVDVTEEIIRLRSHLEQFQKLIKEEIVGRKMDFLLQEMGREVNTIGSKSVDVEIAKCVIEMKSELEKIREQAQNIE